MYLRRTSLFLWAAIVFSLFLGMGYWVSGSKGGVSALFSFKKAAISLGVAGYSLLAISILLASRWKKLESWIGGLDQMYQLHRTAAIWGFSLTLLHPLLMASHGLFTHPERLLLTIFPIHGKTSTNLGSLALLLMTLIMGITWLNLFPYQRWKKIHRLMVVAFLLSFFHIIPYIGKQIGEYRQLFLSLPTGIGFFGIFYKNLFFPFFGRRYVFNVTNVHRIDDNLVEISLAPRGDPVPFIPGQYGFFTFEAENFARESHPFTLIDGKLPSEVVLLVKVRGDFTRQIYDELKGGERVTLEGPYGRFDSSRRRESQLWIGGGIGIAPFLAWIRSSNQKSPSKQIDFYYCVRKKIDAPLYEEFLRFGKNHPNFRCFLHCSEEKGHLDIQTILSKSKEVREKTIFLCGPPNFTRSLERQLHDMGVRRTDIVFENFAFF